MIIEDLFCLSFSLTCCWNGGEIVYIQVWKQNSPEKALRWSSRFVLSDCSFLQSLHEHWKNYISCQIWNSLPLDIKHVSPLTDVRTDTIFSNLSEQAGPRNVNMTVCLQGCSAVNCQWNKWRAAGPRKSTDAGVNAELQDREKTCIRVNSRKYFKKIISRHGF